MSTQPLIELNNGIQIPQLGFGTFRVSVEETQKVTEEALAVGYRHIDTAAGYYNEAGVGAALKASGLPRESVFVTTKLRNGDQGYDSALKAFEDSRAALGVDVVDLYLVHWPCPQPWAGRRNVEGLREAVRRGRCACHRRLQLPAPAPRRVDRRR